MMRPWYMLNARTAIMGICLHLLMIAGPAIAQGSGDTPPVFPDIEGNISAEVQIDHGSNGLRPGLRATTFEGTLEPEVTVWLAPFASLHTNLSLDSTDNRLSDQNSNFGSVGLRVQELYLHLAIDNLVLFGGKLDVDFGIAWDDAFGLYGTDLAEEYEFDERIGAGAGVRFGSDVFGQHQLSALVFFADTSVLSGDLITGRDHLSISDGGVSNTESPSSFAVSLSGDDFSSLIDLGYHTSITLQSAGRGDQNDLFGISFALTGSAALCSDLSFHWLAEAVHLLHAEGGPGDRTYLTMSGKFAHGGIWLAPTVTHRVDSGRGVTGSETTLATLSVGYDFDWGLTLSAGVQLFEDAGSSVELFGAKAEYTYDF